MESGSVSGERARRLRDSDPVLHLVTLEDRGQLPLARAERLLEPAERARAFQISNPEARRQFVLGRFLLRRMLEELGVPSSPLRIDAQGKPYLEGRPVDFNLSHTRGGVAVLLGKGEVGVDVEQVHRRVDVRGVGTRTFTHSELQWVQAGDHTERFIQMWTLKEAYIKARGMGFRLSPKSFTFDLTTGSARIVRSIQPVDRGWIFHQEQLGTLRVALAARGPGSERGAVLKRYDGAMLF